MLCPAPVKVTTTGRVLVAAAVSLVLVDTDDVTSAGVGILILVVMLLTAATDVLELDVLFFNVTVEVKVVVDEVVEVANSLDAGIVMYTLVVL